MTAQDKFDDVVLHSKYFAPKFKTILKTDSKFHKAIGWFLGKLGNPAYMTSFWTTIGQTVARPTICKDGASDGEWAVLFHELQHARDANTIGTIPFSLLYLFPQCLGFLGVLYTLIAIPAIALGAPLALLWGVLSLLCLLPLPALGRAWLESRGYLVTLAVNYWSGDIQDEEERIDWISDQFTGPNYYYMFPFRRIVKWYFAGKLKELKTGMFTLDAFFAVCRTKSFQYK